MVFPDDKEESRELSDEFTISDSLNNFIERFEVEDSDIDNIGLFGYTTFNCVIYTEIINIKESKEDKNDAPDMLYILYKYILVFNHFSDEITLIELQGIDEMSNLNKIESLINQRNFANYNFFTEGEEYSTISNEEYKQYVRKGVEHCMKGDIFQIVLSRRFVQPFSGDDFKVYRALRSINPSPYLFYFDFGGYRIFGSSPETHCKVQGNKISIDPIAGTTKRTANYQEDMEGVDLLLNDPKENAEHVMLVDLARNDLSRNAHDV